MAPFDINVTKRSARSPQDEVLPIHRNTRARNNDEEKRELSEDSEDDSEVTDDTDDHLSSRETSSSYGSHRPMLRRGLRRPSAVAHRNTAYRLPHKVVRWLCCALISTVVLFIVVLIRMSVVSSRSLELGQHKRPPAPPPAWEAFDFLTRYYGGIRTLVPASENTPQYPTLKDETPLANDTLLEETPIPIRGIPASKPFLAYQNQTSASYLSEYVPAQECFLDAKSTIRIPQLQYYQGRPSGFPENVMGSYELLDLPSDICFERYGRLGPYGYGYSLRNGGSGTGQHGEKEGSEAVWAQESGVNQVDYSRVDWADAQKRCYAANSARFEHPPASSNSTETEKTLLPRTAVVIRTWDDFDWKPEHVMNLRAMISELSIGSGGEYEVHLLVQVHDEAKFPIWADPETFQTHLNASVPAEFRGIATLWSQTQMLMVYQGIHDTFARGPDLPVHGVYRGLQMAIQYFAQQHTQYDYFWHWEIDVRYTGHYYDFFSKAGSWSKEQPRKGLWERSGRFYVPSVHGTWEDFKQMARVQTEMGTVSSTNVWSGLKGAKNAPAGPKADKPIWGPERPADEADWFEIENDPVPPTGHERDKYVWGVGEEADLISFNPIFDPEGTTWGLADDITGYNNTQGLPPRRAVLVAASRMSKRLLNTMHRETTFKKHFAFSEMWAPTAALHHGYKAVYVPHPMFIDREWPTEYLASVMNGGRNGAVGGARTSVFGDREHNLLGTTWFYNAGFAPNLWKRWMGLKIDNEGGEEFETTVQEGRSGKGGPENMKGGEGRMCLPPMLLHPVKEVDLPVEEALEKGEIPESDPSA